MSPSDPARSLNRRFLAALVCVAALIVLDQWLIQPELSRLASDAPVINVAGRQRMLSQKLTKTALVLARETDPVLRERSRQELSGVLDLWSRSHRGLQDGDPELRLPGTSTPEVAAAFAELEPEFVAMHAAAQSILRTSTAQPTDLDEQVRTLLHHEPRFLERMHAIVGLYESEARRRVTSLERTGWTIAIAIVATMAGLALFAIRPAARRLERQYLQSQRQCETLADQLAHADRLKSVGEIAAGIAHEVNQPLGAIANYAEGSLARIASGSTTVEELRSPLQRMLAAALKAGQVIRRVKRFSQNRPHVVMTASLNDLVRDVLDLFEPELRRRQIRVALNLDESEPTLSCDALQISQVLTNLVQNAVRALDAVPESNRWLTAITSHDGEESVTATIRDSGPGIAPDMLNRLFRPFSTDRTDGLGMGLSIVRSIVEGHGGTVSGSNAEYGGAVFTVRLPRQGATALPANVLEGASHA
ncbi:MAG: ATP-binding protein [Planctomycetaceae bacterium]|nr:ATP-binding protein [Planctomycetaceae bacterium]